MGSPHRPDVLESEHAPQPRGRPVAARRRGPGQVALHVLLAMVLGVAVVVALVHDGGDQADADRVELVVGTGGPLGGAPGGWTASLEVRNAGPGTVWLLGISLPAPVVVLDLHETPLRLSAGATDVVLMRVRLDCGRAPGSGRNPEPVADVRARTAHRQAFTQRVGLSGMTDLVTRLAREQCGSPVGAASQRLAVTYAGSEFRRGAIVSNLLVGNGNRDDVTVLTVTGASGWPGLARGRPAALPAVISAGRSLRLSLEWDVSACPRLERRAVISSLRLVVVVAADLPAVATFDLGDRYADDFFTLYGRRCR